MSDTKKHKNKGKFNNGLLEELPRDLEKMFDRWNWVAVGVDRLMLLK